MKWIKLATGVDEVDKACYWSGWSFLLEWMKWIKLATGVDEDCYWSGCLQLEWKTCVETNSFKSMTKLQLFYIYIYMN